MVLTATITSSQSGFHGCQWDCSHEKQFCHSRCRTIWMGLYWNIILSNDKYKISHSFPSSLAVNRPFITQPNLYVFIMINWWQRFIVKTLHPTSVCYISKVVHYITNLFSIFWSHSHWTKAIDDFLRILLWRIYWTDYETKDGNKESFTRTVNVTVLWAAPLILLTLSVNNTIRIHWNHF